MQGRKTGGRTKGTPNRVTKELRDRLKSVFYEELENLPSLLAQLSPEKRADLLVRMAPYLLPRVEPVAYLEDDPDLNW